MTETEQDLSRLRAEFFRDGSLRDIYVLSTRRENWAVAAIFMARRYPFEFLGDWREATFPNDVGRLFPTSPDSPLTTLAIDVSGVRVVCHFFTVHEVELDLDLDLDPAQVSESSKVDAIFAFTKGLSSAVGKGVLLTPENLREPVIFRCRPGQAWIR